MKLSLLTSRFISGASMCALLLPLCGVARCIVCSRGKEGRWIEAFV